MPLDLKTAVQRLKDKDNILILCHRRPDGDTIGSAFGICFALEQIGKNVMVDCADPFPEKFDYIYKNYDKKTFAPDYIIAVDMASQGLLGDYEETYAGKIDLVIDHHGSNTFFGKETLLDVKAAATTEICYNIILGINTEITPKIADALYTGITTDTGCFRFSNVTPTTHRIAADLIEAGANHAEINRIHFESTSKERLRVEAMARTTMEYYENDRISLLYLPNSIYEEYGVTEDDLDGITSLPRMIEGVKIGLTIKGSADGTCRISVRSFAPYDASSICANFGGGGHVAAAGCMMEGSFEDVKNRLLAATTKELNKY